YGRYLGLAFQVADDVLDYTANPEMLGKNLGDDLAEGKATLPLIHALTHSAGKTRQRLKEIIQNGDTRAMSEVLDAIHACDGMAYSQSRATEYATAANRALDTLPPSDYLDALRGLTRYAVARRS
ncbi:MAG: octaprenyl-diphosphate synthase, partial [Gammaproteobacteria bacterium HGW-Gammaproteobacteria-7]